MQDALPSMPGTADSTAAPSRLRAVGYRVGQFAGQAVPRSSRETDSALAALLPPAQLDLVMRLAPVDRHHLLAVHRALVADGWTDPELLTAALLHDVGKADTSGRAGPVHRAIKVLLQAFAPDALPRLARYRGGWLRHGLYLALNHAAIGADLARRTGAGERTCWLIAHHDNGRMIGDRALQALRERDARE